MENVSRDGKGKRRPGDPSGFGFLADNDGREGGLARKSSHWVGFAFAKLWRVAGAGFSWIEKDGPVKAGQGKDGKLSNFKC
jgi:hypothetical protein